MEVEHLVHAVRFEYANAAMQCMQCMQTNELQKKIAMPPKNASMPSLNKV
jgi:hypothetical protein